MLSTSPKEGFAMLGTLLTKKKSKNKRSRQKASLSSSDGSSSDVSSEEQQSHPAPKQRKRLEGQDDHIDSDVKDLLASPGKGEDQEENALQKCGPEVTDKLAKVVDKLLRSRLSDDGLNEKQYLYLRRTTCTATVPTRFGTEIWTQLDKDDRVTFAYIRSKVLC